MAEQKYLCDRCARYPCSENETKLIARCPGFYPKLNPITNAEHLRAMSDVELARYFADCGIDCYSCPADCLYCYPHQPTCVVAWLNWLRSPCEKE